MAEDRAADLGDVAAVKAKPERRGSIDVANRVVIVGGELVPENGPDEPKGRRKSRELLKQEVRRKHSDFRSESDGGSSTYIFFKKRFENFIS